jgi:hypothetical protein
MDAPQPHLAAQELDVFIQILQEQRNAALTELARLAARATVLQREVEELKTLLGARADSE